MGRTRLVDLPNELLLEIPFESIADVQAVSLACRRLSFLCRALVPLHLPRLLRTDGGYPRPHQLLALKARPLAAWAAASPRRSKQLAHVLQLGPEHLLRFACDKVGPVTYDDFRRLRCIDETLLKPMARILLPRIVFMIFPFTPEEHSDCSEDDIYAALVHWWIYCEFFQHQIRVYSEGAGRRRHLELYREWDQCFFPAPVDGDGDDPPKDHKTWHRVRKEFNKRVLRTTQKQKCFRAMSPDRYEWLAGVITDQGLDTISWWINNDCAKDFGDDITSLARQLMVEPGDSSQAVAAT